MTIRQTLYDKLPSDVAGAAVFNIQAQQDGPKRILRNADDECASVDDALMSFIWWHTDEGFDYWLTIYKRFKSLDENEAKSLFQ